MLLAALVAVGCGAKKSFSERAGPRPDGVFVASIGITPATLDPALSQDSVTNDLMAHIHEGLVGWGSDGTIQPRLAERWDISPDRRVYTFHLRPGLIFHNGAPVTAADVKWSWERACDPRLESPIPEDYLGDIVGVADVIAGKAPNIAGVRATDPLTLEVQLVAPRAFFLGKLTYPIASVLPEGFIQKGEVVGGAKQMIGAGPFKVIQLTPEAEVKLEGFEGYFRGAPAVRDLTYLIVKDSSTRVNLLRGGKLDWAGLPPTDVDAFRRDPNFVLLESDRPGTFYVGMNGQVYPPFADVRVRRAFNHAVDRTRLVRDLLGGFGTVAEGILPPSVPNLPRKKPTLGYDPARSRALVAEAGWSGRLPPLELVVSDPTGDRKRMAELIVSMLRENLGVDARVKQVESGVLIHKATRRELGFFLGSWYMDYLDPENLLSGLLSSRGQNRTGYDSPTFNALCARADAMPDGPQRMRVYADAEDLAIRDAVWIPLYHPREVIAVRKGIEGFVSNPLGMLPPMSVTRR